MVAGEASNGGTCTYLRAGVLQVRRDTTDVSGCRMVDYIRQHEIRDAALEAELSVTAGCAGLWSRTGTRGYFLAVCADRTIRMHELGDTPPGERNLLIRFTPTFDPAKVVVGWLVRDTSFTVYVDGKPLRTVTNGDIRSGRVGIGGFAPETALDATFTQFRAWAPNAS